MEEPKYSVGHEIYATYDNVDSLNYHQAEEILLKSLAKDNFGLEGGTPQQYAGRGFLVAHLLSESHVMLFYEKDKKRLISALYTCRDRNDGKETFKSLSNRLHRKPSSRFETPAFVRKDFSLENKEQGYSSVSEASKSLSLDPESLEYLACTFFDIPPDNFEDKKLEKILEDGSKRLDKNPEGERPDHESWHRFKPGFSVLYSNEVKGYVDQNGILLKETPQVTSPDLRKVPTDIHSLLGLHTFEEHNSIHYGGFGKVKNVLPAIELMGKLLQSKYIVLRNPTKDITEKINS